MLFIYSNQIHIYGVRTAETTDFFEAYTVSGERMRVQKKNVEKLFALSTLEASWKFNKFLSLSGDWP